MAKIMFAAEAEEILGKLAGSIFQDSYLGLQIRGWTKPRNPQTQLSQLRRGDFRFLSAGWRNLTPTEQATWSDQAGSIPEGLRLFLGNNINLILINEPFISSYSSGSSPGEMTIEISQVNTTTFQIFASGAITTVPADTKLLILATSDKPTTKIFNNPSEYQPITFFDAGTDLSSTTDILAAWQAHYGQIHDNRRVCIKAVLIDTENGTRGAASLTCSITQTLKYYLFTISQSGTADPTIVDVFNNTTMIINPTRIGSGFYYLNISGTIPDLNNVAGGIAFPTATAEFIVEPILGLPAYYLQTIQVGTGLHADGLLTDVLFFIFDNN